ncbi:MAG: hypothetical protein H6632_00205 [Anaerolineales bacterium]|nr:hypothetical protein [Anaerolineales bacterium]
MLNTNLPIEPLPLVQTKLYRPLVNADLIQRPHLLARLDDGLRHKLSLVSAPPGFGKTTLAAQWLAGCRQPIAWVSLDERDNPLPQFLRYVCAAVRRAVPEACDTLHHLLTTATLPDVDYLADLLVEELNALPEPLILALDDYHHIRSSEVHQVLRTLLHYRPPRLHLVILTRSDPPLFLGRLRMARQITEIRAADLRFALTETRPFLLNNIEQPLDDAALQSLQTRTEGWATGLQLAVLALQSQTPAQFLTRFDGSHRLLAGYLIEEVMTGLPESVSTFLTRTALIDRFCAPLGDALLADSRWPASSQAIIAQLEQQNLFIISLDDTGMWFRYHDLFRDFLLNQLKKEQSQIALAELHRRAGNWLAQAGLIEDALRHLLAAGDETCAADLVETHFHPLMNEQIPAPVLVRWLDLFPEQTIQAHPGLAIAQLFLFVLRWDLAAIAATVNQVRALVQADSTPTDERRRLRLAVVDGIQGYQLFWQGDTRQALPLFQRGLDNLKDPVAYTFIHAQMVIHLAQSYANSGHRETALALLRTALADATAHHRPVMVMFLVVRTIIYFNAGELVEAVLHVERVLATANSPQARRDWPSVGLVQVWRGWANYFFGSIRYEQNDLESASRHWQQVEAMRYQVNPGAFHDSLTGLALIAQAQGDAVQALAYAQTAREFAVELRSPPLLARSEALEIRLALWGNSPVETLRRSQTINTTPNQANAVWLEPPRLTLLRLLVAEATPDSLAHALQMAETCLHQAERAYNTRQIIKVTALQALIWSALRHTTKAFESLNRALILAEQGGFVRTFLDMGVPMMELLQQFDHQHDSSLDVKHLLATFAKELDTAGRRELTAQYVQLYNITPLTQRELELLELVDQRLTVAEMADRLVISPNTVKKHVSNIYTKLGAKNRREAIATAKEVGLLEVKS